MAGEWALAQFTDISGTIIGAPATNATGLANAADEAQANLADVTTGLPAAFWTTYDANEGTCTLVECGVLEANDALGNMLGLDGETPGPPSNSCVVIPSVVPPVNCDGLERLDTFANILAARVETSGPTSGACTTLLGDTGSSTTTLQASHYLATNPGGTSNIANLFALQSGSPPFTPALTSAPDGWEFALNFRGANFDAPSALAIDASGNVWVPNFFGDSVSELTPSGGLAGNYDPAGASFDGPDGVAIDSNGNAWMANSSGGTVTELTSSGGLAGNYAPAGANFDNPEGPTIDASGDVWVANSSSGYVTKLTSSGALIAGTNDSGNILSPSGIAIDASGNAWVVDQSGGKDASGALDCIAANVGSATINDNSGLGTSNFSEPYGIAVDSSDNIWVTNAASNGVTELTPTTGGNVTVAGYYAPAGGNFNTTYSVAIDASGNVWAANSGSASVAEIIGAAGPVLTPLEACLTQASPAAVCLP